MRNDRGSSSCALHSRDTMPAPNTEARWVPDKQAVRKRMEASPKPPVLQKHRGVDRAKMERPSPFAPNDETPNWFNASTMNLFHVTTYKAWESIWLRGVDPSFSQTGRAVCYFVTEKRLPWAIAHVQKRHNTTGTLVLGVTIPRNWLQRVKRGVWCCDRKIKVYE